MKKIEAEKKAMSDLKKVINICLKKGFHFSVNPECNLITASYDRYDTSLYSYFRGNLLNYFEESGTVAISQMLTILQSKK
jgi:hypothetical protein